MARLTVVISGSNSSECIDFLAHHGFDGARFQVTTKGVVGRLDEGEAERLYQLLQGEASRAWEDPDATVLEFDSAYFPASATAIHPVRQLRGKVAASLSRRRANLAPACASPGMFFGASAGARQTV